MNDLTTISDKLSEIFKSILNVSVVRINDDLFSLGATSLSMLRAAQQIHVAFNVTVPLETLLSEPTINGIAKYIVSHGMCQGK